MLTTRIKSWEKGLLFRHGEFIKMLEPGKYRCWSRLWSPLRAHIHVVSTLNTAFAHPLLDVLLKDAKVRAALTVVDLADHERALIWKNGRFERIVGPGRHAFWNEPHELDVEVFDTTELRFAHVRADAICEHSGTRNWLHSCEVSDFQSGLLVKAGQILGELRTGRNLVWAVPGVQFKVVDRREQVADVTGQEIMTRDKVTLRVNLLVTYQVNDVLKAVTVVNDSDQALYREAQLALRAAVGTRTLDALLADKESVGGEVRAALAGRAQEFGVTVRSIGLKDIILPGEMKVILNQVIEAEKAAQANLIKRREETAAARSQANTAKLLADNPVLAKMKELELLQEVLAGAKVSFVLGDGDVAGQLRRLASNGESDQA